MYLERIRILIEKQYEDHPTGCGGSFGELLCWEIHINGLTFIWLAEKWGVSLHLLGELIYDHCKRLEKEPAVNHNYKQVEKQSDAFALRYVGKSKDEKKS